LDDAFKGFAPAFAYKSRQVFDNPYLHHLELLEAPRRLTGQPKAANRQRT
jgi:hypothetical protein